jgi:hypothetical protein
MVTSRKKRVWMEHMPSFGRSRPLSFRTTNGMGKIGNKHKAVELIDLLFEISARSSFSA